MKFVTNYVFCGWLSLKSLLSLKKVPWMSLFMFWFCLPRSPEETIICPSFNRQHYIYNDHWPLLKTVTSDRWRWDMTNDYGHYQVEPKFQYWLYADIWVKNQIEVWVKFHGEILVKLTLKIGSKFHDEIWDRFLVEILICDLWLTTSYYAHCRASPSPNPKHMLTFYWNLLKYWVKYHTGIFSSCNFSKIPI